MLAFLLLVLLSTSASTVLSAPFVPSSATFIRATTYNVGDEPWQHYNQSEYTFDGALVDHFNLSTHATYSQRYFTVAQFAHNTSSPVLYLLCGEYTCPGVNPARLFPLQLAYEFGAYVVAIEHRYYGESYPTAPTTAQLGLLNSRQALNDFAWFQHFYQTSVLSAQSGARGDNRWFVIGGSYPGALSAWYRLKYPHLVVGSIASSAVVEAVLEFPEFDAQVERSAGPVCAAALRNITALVEAAMPAVEKQLGCPSNMNDGDFLFMIADSGVEGVQYGYRLTLCDYVVPHYLRLVEASAKAAVAHSSQWHTRVVDAVSDAVVASSIRSAQLDLLQAFVNYTNNVFFGEQGNSCGEYDRRHWMDETMGNADRSWGWQKVGYWQTARRPGQSIRSQRINRAYYQQLCKEVFGVTELPAINATNNYFGGAHLATSNTFFLNGVEDPWQWASVRHTLAPTVPAVVVNCTQCAHCVEEYTPTAADDEVLVAVRRRVTAFVRHLLFES